MQETARIIKIEIREGKEGLFFASSNDEPGFFLCVTRSDQLWDAIPLALEDYFRSKNQAVSAIPTQSAQLHTTPWAIVPQGLIRRANERAGVL